ncbi:DUF2871 domain-containing protein [uncultured Clostridium sp.]|uniref:DUF2871 domain-containing protein n=1 Tax=uncultured Clostridium sp. TaxID=59620 RepID=UPI003216D632
MKKLINTSLIYAISSMILGVFYREFTKFNNFTGNTTLSLLHVHLFTLGMLFFLIVALLNNNFSISNHKKFNFFFYTYNIGLAITVIVFLWRGILQTLLIESTSSINAAISGIAGIGHILIAIGIITFFIIIKSQIKSKEEI